MSVEFDTRLRLTVNDSEGARFPVAFHEPGLGLELLRKGCKAGNTLVVLYPNQHRFLDRTVGFRIEDMETTKV